MRSRVDGTWSGWSGDTIVPLENGTRPVQDQTSIWIDEDLDHLRLDQGLQDGDAERVAQGLQLALSDDRMNRHSGARWTLLGSAWISSR